MTPCASSDPLRLLESCPFEACARSHWLLHAFAVMSNHFHLALETPEGNLVAGMQWLQSTFANRFNRLRDIASESGLRSILAAVAMIRGLRAWSCPNVRRL